MTTKRSEVDRWVLKFTKPTFMKFQPIQDYQQPTDDNKDNLITRIRHYFSPPAKQKGQTIPPKRDQPFAFNKILHKKQHNKPQIKFVKRLTNEHILVGNEDQVDAMNISGIISDFVDIEYIWTIKLRGAIVQVAVDHKRNYIILLAEKNVHIYGFEHKNMHTQPFKIGSVNLIESTKHIHVLREGIFALTYGWGIEVYTVDPVKGIRMGVKKKFALPQQNIQVFQVPEPIENTLNVFFQEKIVQDASFALWCIQIQFFQKEVKISKALRVYQISGFQRDTTRIENYSKAIYLINLGKNILAVRKGYVIDSASVTIQAGNNYLRYLSNNKLIHVTDNKVEVYNFSINEHLHPPRIVVQSTDSIEIPQFSNKYEYVESLQMLGENFGIFYQLKPEENKLTKGETKYAFMLTHAIKMEDKLKEVLHQQIDNIEQKADMANKMGLKRKDIYLRLWNNSNKSSVQDIKLLLDTLDYDIIKAEIEKKLKKSSMVYRQVQLIEQGCNSLLHSIVFKPNNTTDDIKNYLISDMLIRKLNLYKLIAIEDKRSGKTITQDPQGKLLINIQNYNYYRTVDIKNMLFEHINRYVNEDKDQIMKIRLIIRQFKFPLRIVYQQFIAGIINITKKNFLKILTAIPELLPFEPQGESTDIDSSLLTGIWSPITQEDWQHLHINTVQTIDNKVNLKEVISSVWYKRHWLSLHDFIDLSRQQIQAIQNKNNSEVTFYLAIESIFQFHDYNAIRKTIDFIQDTYTAMPQHMYGKIFLYKELYDHFKANRHFYKVEEFEHFEHFLKLRDPNLFKNMFNFQKVKKGFILKQIKPIYQRLSCVEVFNQGLLNYFSSPLCQISDIKYILNRLNNQKRQFHEQNKGIYEVLVRGMQLQMKLGSEHDIPIDEVLIYIENIPFLQNSPLQRELYLMRQISQYSSRFKDIKLNMSVFEVANNMDKVIASLVHSEVEKHNILKLSDNDKIRQLTRQIIQDIEDIKNKLYPNQGNHELTLFTYLCDLMAQQSYVSVVAELLDDEWVNKEFNITKKLIENIVLYSYNQQMRKQPLYVYSTPHLRQILTLLTHDSHLKQYIEAQIAIAQMLSSPQVPVRYPLSQDNSYFTSTELLTMISMIPGEKVEQIDIEDLYENMRIIQILSSDGQLQQITLTVISQMIIIRMIECRLLKEVLPKIQKIIQLNGQCNENFIYPALVISKLVPQMIEQNRQILLKCSSHLFRNPLKLLALLEQMMNSNQTSAGYKKLLLKYYSQIRYESLNYSQSSQIFDPQIIAILETDELKKNFIFLLRYSLYNLIAQKQQFSRPQFYLMFIMLTNDPNVLVKYVYINRNTLNLKQLRCFLSYMIKQDLFSKTNVLQFGKRMFFMIFKTIIRNKKIEEMVDTFKEVPLHMNIEMDSVEILKNELQKKFALSIDRFKHKLKVVNNATTKRKNQEAYESARIQSIKKRLVNPKSKQGRYQYPFADSDDAPNEQNARNKSFIHKQPSVLQPFDSQFQRQSILNREDDSLKSYLSLSHLKERQDAFYAEKQNKQCKYGNLIINKVVAKRIAQVADPHLSTEVKNISIQHPGDSTLRKTRIGSINNLEINDLLGFHLPPPKTKMRKNQSIRSRAIEDITAEQRQVIEKEQQQLVMSHISSIVGNPQSEAAILLQIVKSGAVVSEDTTLNFEPLARYQTNDNFRKLLKEMCGIAYKNTAMSFRSVLFFVKKMNEAFIQLGINKQWINIYLRAEALQNKFNLELPLRDIFTVDGLSVQSQIPETLFNFLFPNIMKNVNDQNIYKLCKVVNLAFKKTDLEQQILFQYLMDLLKEYQTSIEISDTSQQDLDRQVDKFKGLIHKMPIKHLIDRQADIFKLFPEQKVRKDIVNMFIESFNIRYDFKAADFLSQKYISALSPRRKK